MKHTELMAEHVAPADIERTSFSIIARELAERGKTLDPVLAPVIMRVIHTTADFEYADTLVFSDHVIERISQALRDGADIVTDTNMALAGINKTVLSRYGGSARCFMADPDVAQAAAQNGTTRAAASMRKAAALSRPVVFAVGNAPTALLELYALMQEGFRPEAVIGVPVGFVNVVAAKELIMTAGAPYIVSTGRKGGSTVAAAICNAVLYAMDAAHV